MPIPPEWKPITGEQRKLLDKKIAIFDDLQKNYRPVGDSLITGTDESENTDKQSIDQQQIVNAEVEVSEQREPDVDIKILQFLKEKGASDQDLILVGAEMISNR
jgi:hypothetical protein